MSLCLCVFEQSFVLVMGSLSKVVAFACSSRLLFGFGRVVTCCCVCLLQPDVV